MTLCLVAFPDLIVVAMCNYTQETPQVENDKPVLGYDLATSASLFMNTLRIACHLHAKPISVL